LFSHLMITTIVYDHVHCTLLKCFASRTVQGSFFLLLTVIFCENSKKMNEKLILKPKFSNFKAP
jgi:hypothetical protein